MNTTSNKKIRLGLIYGSTRNGRFCDIVANWAAEQIRLRSEFELDLIDPLKFDLPAHYTKEPLPGIVSLKERVEQADAFLVVVPEYNHSFPASIKHVIDLLFTPWAAKAIGVISYGGHSGGFRATEQLRLVFAELHAIVIRESVAFSGARNLFDDKGKLIEPERYLSTMSKLLDQLYWWSSALIEARSKTPYPPVTP